jgi:hypothetical protein
MQSVDDIFLFIIAMENIPSNRKLNMDPKV